MDAPSIVTKWFRSSQDRLGLDILLGQAPQSSSKLAERLNWLRRLVNWVRRVGPSAAELGLKADRIQIARLRYILVVLDRNPELKKRVAESLRLIMRDTRALELFMNVGIPNQESFIGEFMERLNLWLLPQPPGNQDLVAVFSETFRFESDAEWIQHMDPQLFAGWLALFHYSESNVDRSWNTLVQDARDSIYLMGHTVRSIGLSRLIRNRVKESDFRNLPFYGLTERIDTLLKAQDGAERTQAYQALQQVLERCADCVEEVYGYFREHGVSIPLVYQVERLRAQMKRLGTLARLLAGYQDDPSFIQEFIGLLVQENIRARKFKGLFGDNIAMVCHKIVETNAETGEHYITRNRGEFLQIIKKAVGGGVMTGATTLFKFLLAHVSAPPFIAGGFAFANYSVSFLAIQLFGFTLATKQPAMTASALASKLQEGDDSVDALVDELVHLIRSQLAAVAGNIWGVIPAVFLLDSIVSLYGFHLTDVHHAEETIHSFSILGMTPFYAAWTGVLLWVSSIFAGWFYNWYCYRGLPEAIEHHPRLRYVFGEYRARKIAAFLKAQMGGFAATFSLAFLLAMVPKIAAFFGLPLDVRHVTLSSGAMTASVLAIGPRIFSEASFWLAVGGIGSMAVLNLAVSFALALAVAIWARKASAPKRGIVYRELFKRVAARPWIFFLPDANPGISHPH